MIKSKAEAQEAYAEYLSLKAEADKLMHEYGITEMLKDAEALKDEATEFCTKKNVKRLELPDGRYGTLIEAVNQRLWIGTKDEVPDDAPETLKPLKSLVDKEVWMKITKRVPDPVKIDEAIQEGIISPNQIAPCYMERMKRPFLRVFGKADEA